MPELMTDKTAVIPDPDRFTVTESERYHLFMRMAATLTVWNARDLNVPSAPQKIDLPSLNPLFQAYDMGCCLVVAPIRLVDAERTGWHALQAAHTLVYYAANKKGWDKVELTGLDTMVNRGAVTAILMNASVLRYTVTEKIKKIIESTREAHPDWLVSSASPRQGSGGQ